LHEYLSICPCRGRVDLRGRFVPGLA